MEKKTPKRRFDDGKPQVTRVALNVKVKAAELWAPLRSRYDEPKDNLLKSDNMSEVMDHGMEEKAAE